MLRPGAAGVLGIALLVVLAEGNARACGGGLVSVAEGNVGANAQRIFISVRSNNTTDIVTEIGVPTSSQDYGVLIPLPGLPTLDPMPVPSTELTRLASATAPRIAVVQSSSDGGCGLCASKGGGGAATPPVVIGGPVNIGPVTAVILDASSADALGQWLGDNSFVIPAASQALIASYSGADRTFVAIRRNTTATSDAPSSVGVHMTLPGDVRDLPLRFARLGAAARVAFTIFVVAPTPAGPSTPFEGITINDLDAEDLTGPGYEEAVFRAIAARGGHALVLELSTDIGSISANLGTRLTGLVDPLTSVTRMSAVFSADALTQDVSFQEQLVREIPTNRTLTASMMPHRNAFASTGSLVGLPLLLGLFVLARSRRPKR